MVFPASDDLDCRSSTDVLFIFVMKRDGPKENHLQVLCQSLSPISNAILTAIENDYKKIGFFLAEQVISDINEFDQTFWEILNWI